MTADSKNNYRNDIDGLRAISVIAVLLYHCKIPGFGGGFIGVDIFFVISGFLISEFLIRDIYNLKFQIIDFYFRRIRRIIPSLFIVKICVILVGALIYDIKTFNTLGKSAILSSIFLSNVYFWKTIGYFDSEVYKSPLIHTWSLSIEEQFYLLFPPFLLYIKKYIKINLYTIIILIALVSFLINLIGVNYYPSATYFLLPTRAWELLIGTIISFKIIPSVNNKLLKNSLFLIGLLLIFASINLIDEHTLFPGYIVLFPILGASIVIYNAINFTSSLQSILELKIFVFIGRISYPLYLWHWPIISFYSYLKVTPWTNLDGLTCIIISFIIAYLTWRYVEMPIKKYSLILDNKKYVYTIILTILVLPLLLGSLILSTKGMHDRVNPEITKIIHETSNDEYWESQNKWEIENSKDSFKTIPTIVGKSKITPSFALIGDSHARALIPAFSKLSAQNDLSGYMITMSSTPPLLGTTIKSTINDNGINENIYNTSVLHFLKNNPNIKTVILTARWGAYINGLWKEKKESPNYSIFYDENNNKIDSKLGLEMGLEAFVDSISSINKKIIILTDVPEIGYDVPTIFWTSSIFPTVINFEEIRPTIKEYYIREKIANNILEKITTKYGLKLIHLENAFYNKSNRAIIRNNEGLLYRDNNHLSKHGSMFLIKILNQCFINS